MNTIKKTLASKSSPIIEVNSIDYFWACSLKERQIKYFMAKDFNHAICAMNSYFNNEPYELGRMIKTSYEQFFKSTADNITDFVEAFLGDYYHKTKTYMAPINSIIANKLIEKPESLTKKRTRKAAV